MNDIKVNKAELLEKLRSNRSAHLAQFEKAADNYRRIVIGELEKRLAEAKLPALVFNLPTPVNQTKEYDRAIAMLEMSVDNVIELEEHDFRQYVQDEWTWSAQTIAGNSRYL